MLVRDQQKTCYITSNPIEQGGTKKRRSAPYTVVTHRGKNLAEMSVSAGYPYKDKSTVDISVDVQPKHEFFTSSKTPQIAWARDAEADKKIVEDMLKGTRMTVAGQGQGKIASTDTYDLQGFPQAYKRMQELCKEDKPQEAKKKKDTQGKDAKKTDIASKDTKKTDTSSKKPQTKDPKKTDTASKDLRAKESKTAQGKDSKPQSSQTQSSKSKDEKPRDSKPRDSRVREQ
ncbi:MAG: hypothetical protein FJZ47_10930 [Candidatus Tectomicrobia bacterium]|uniref:Uncharacterized protein n=1 Tax=Tectimicrobiota bacterium TaxID=2528274 RepID=A0A937W344_UNCTE|nr:hypothetical protein [Candidatus Tectomicrobia bacterium]